MLRSWRFCSGGWTILKCNNYRGNLSCRALTTISSGYNCNDNKDLSTSHFFNYREKKDSSGSGTRYPPRIFLLGLLGFFETKEEETIEDKILMTIKRAILAIQRDQYEKAEKLLHKAYRLSELEQLEDAKTQIIDIQANLHLQRGDLESAEKLFKIVAQRLVHSGRVDAKDNSVVEISIKLAEIYKLGGRHAEAESGFQYCVDTQKEKIEKNGDDDENTLLLAAWSLHGLAQLRIGLASIGKVQKKNVEEAMTLIRDAYQYAVTAVGPDSQQALAIQSDVATTLALLGDVDKAIKTVEECAEIARDKYESLYATLKVNAGNLFLQKGDYGAAEIYCQEASAAASRAQDPESMARALECVKKIEDLRAQKNNNNRKNNTTA